MQNTLADHYKYLSSPKRCATVISLDEPLDGEDGSSLNIPLLLQRAADPETKEVILALSSDVEGRATAAFLAEKLAEFPVKVTRPALGLPAGANLSYADSATIAAAFSGRTGV